MTAPVHVHRFGDPSSPPLVLIHGLSDSGNNWPDAVRRWSADWHIVAIDQRGHGESPRFADDELARMPELWFADALRVVESLGRPVAIVGHSLGGRVGLRVALQRPELVRGLVLEDPSLAPWGERETQVRKDFGDFLEQMVHHHRKHRLLARGRMPSVEINPWVDSKLQTDRRMIEHLDFGEMDPNASLNAVQVPTLLVAPKTSKIIGDPAQVTNPLVRYELLDGVTHTVRRDDPKRYHALVDPFLAGLA